MMLSISYLSIVCRYISLLLTIYPIKLSLLIPIKSHDSRWIIACPDQSAPQVLVAPSLCAEEPLPALVPSLAIRWPKPHRQDWEGRLEPQLFLPVVIDNSPPPTIRMMAKQINTTRYQITSRKTSKNDGKETNNKTIGFVGHSASFA